MDTANRYVGKILDRRYEIKRIIGIGGMAVVFEANDIVMNRTVAVKMLKEDLSDDAEAVKRFINESKAVSMLSHPNIVKIFDVSVKARLKYIVMERVEGITLKSYMQKKGALSREEVISYSEQVLRALEHAHSKGIVHRDIKPQNIMLLKNGRVKVTDFGIAVLPSSDKNPDGKAIGTVYYISPEQASGKETDTRSDLYSLGILMYEMATGTLPFNAETPVSVALMQVREQPKPPSEIRADISRGLEQIILGAMEKSPERRFQSATQMLKYVEKVHLNPEYVFKTRGAAQESTALHAANDMKKQINKKKSVKRRKESSSMFPIILGVAVAFAIVLITGAVTVLDWLLQDQSAQASEQVKVPNVIGEIYSQQTIGDLLDSSIYKVELKYKSDDAPAGTIINQEPAPNSSRKVIKHVQYCTVKITVSLGANLVSVPDLVNYHYKSAELIAKDQTKFDFKVKFVEVTNEAFKYGLVVKTEPAAGEAVEYGSTITIYYSVGPEYEYVTVDDYTGKTPAQASTLIAGDLRIDKNTAKEYSETVPEGRIISQSLLPGSYLKGSLIKFTISLGPSPQTDPPSDTQTPEITP
ncbi:MAG: Stk1 family PASTA domain-containing Ser/Thr kinase [Ruminococcaceae bacterium]|nr:Stk1 family PASTA domain-containing Ser/Thr kinase [Oscillospiraceae bacterium]